MNIIPWLFLCILIFINIFQSYHKSYMLIDKWSLCILMHSTCTIIFINIPSNLMDKKLPRSIESVL